MIYAGPYGPFAACACGAHTLFFTLALPGLFDGTKGIRWMNAIGDLSYPAISCTSC